MRYHLLKRSPKCLDSLHICGKYHDNNVQWFPLNGVTSKSRINNVSTLMDPSALVSIQVFYEFDECRSPWLMMHFGNLIESDFSSCIDVINRDWSRLINVTGRDGSMGLNFGSTVFLPKKTWVRFFTSLCLRVLISKMGFNVLCKWDHSYKCV